MRAMVLESVGQPLQLRSLPVPLPGPHQILLRVEACGVCRTDLHVVNGELFHPKLPLIPGHEIIGIVDSMGTGAERFKPGIKVGVPWLGHTDGTCRFCLRGQENLCDNAEFTGYNLDGGYCEYMVAYEDYCYQLPMYYDSINAAPLMCAGLIGYRSYRMTGENAIRIGLYGFGASAHIITQVAVFQKKEIYAFTREKDTSAQEFARKLGAVWAGASTEHPPVKLDAAIIFAPAGQLVPAALKAVDKGGVVVCAGIHMSDIPSFPYDFLWQERIIRSVANLTRRDGDEFLKIAPEIPVVITTHVYPLEKANEALSDLQKGKINGAAVLVV